MPLKTNITNWLLEPDNPPVRYLTLTQLLHRPADSREVEEARAALMTYSVTKGILEHASEFGGTGRDAYWKYKGAFWQTIFLGELLADGRYPAIADLVSSLLDKADWVSKFGGQCLTANLLAAYRRLGFGGHPVVEEQTERLAERLLADGGIRCGVMDYSLLPRCHMALPKLLRCFVEVPPAERSTVVTEAIDFVANALLEREVYVYVPGNHRQWVEVLDRMPKKEELPAGQTVKQAIAIQRDEFIEINGLGERVPKPGWAKFGFPLHYNSDILEALYALADADVPMQPSLQRAVQVVEEKRRADGRWLLENSLNGKMWVDVEQKAKPSKWITYRAMRVLGHFRAECPGNLNHVRMPN